MTTMREIVESYLEEDGWDFETDEETNTFRTGIGGQNGDYAILIHAAEEEQILLIYMAIADVIQPEVRLPLCEYLCRANYGLAIGNFEIDMEDGEVLFRVSIDVEGGTLSGTMINNMIGEAFSSMERFYPGIKAVAFEGKAPKDSLPPPEEAPQ